MKLFDLFKKPESIVEDEKEQVFISLDIGTSYIKALLCKIRFGRVRVLNLVRLKQVDGNMKGGMIMNLNSVSELCAEVKSLLLEDSDKEDSPSMMITGIAGEMIFSEVLEVNYSRTDPESKINQEELTTVINKTIAQNEKHLLTAIYEKSGLKPDDLILLDIHVNEAFIGSYRVLNPLGFSGKEIQIRIFVTYAPKAHVTALESIASDLGLQMKKIVPIPYAISNGYINGTNENFSGIFIDIGAGTTDIAVTNDGAIIGTQMFAMGGNIFTREICQELGITTEEAELKKIIYSQNIDPTIKISKYIDTSIDLSMHKSEQIQIRRAFERKCRLWNSAVELSLSEFDELNKFPSNIYLSGGGSILPDIISNLRLHPWLDVLPFDRYPQVTHLTPENISNVDDPDKYLSDTDDVAVASVARMMTEI